MALWITLLLALIPVAAQQIDVQLQKALAAHQAGDMDTAIREYRTYLTQKPNAFEARANLGAALAKQGYFEEAIKEYKTALKAAPTNPGISFNLALAYYKTGDLTMASRELAALRALVGDQPQVNLLLADTWLQMGEYKRVVGLLEPAAQRGTEDLGVAYALGMALLKEGRVEDGQKYLDKILRNGESAEAMLMLGVSKVAAGDYPNAMKDFQKAVELNPKLPSVNASLGQALLATGDSAGAMKAFGAELAMNPNDFTSNLQLGVIRKNDEQFAEALEHFGKALRTRPGDVGVRYQLASVYLAQGKADPARQELEALVKEVPHFTEAHVSLATAYYRLKRKEDGDRERAIVQKLNAEAQEKQPKGQPVP